MDDNLDKNTIAEEQLINNEDTSENTNETADINQNEAVENELNEIEKLELEVAEWKDKYTRLFAEFDNHRKRTMKEKLESIQTAGKEIIVSMLDVVDDCDRSVLEMEKSDDAAVLKTGVNLIFNKLKTILQQKGLKSFESKNETFDVELHEAVTEIPVTDKKMIGKVVDELQKGYYLNDKLIRHAKVVVGKE
ncbi:MAG: nucleotide exchange factor GrpE [Chitinophagaceae bacterium]|nr:nucleotide exchange factor GrpE [Chitinophagaceae bacterium]